MTPRVLLTEGASRQEQQEAHRLSLSGTAWARLVEISGAPVSPEFDPPEPADGATGTAAGPVPDAGTQAMGRWQHITAALAGRTESPHGDPGTARGPFPDADAELRARGVLVPDTGASEEDEGSDGPPERVHPSVLANLAILARPRVLIRVEANLTSGRRLALLGLADELGATVVRTGGDGGVELSMFAARTLGHEIVRLVPTLDLDEEDPTDQEDPRAGEDRQGPRTREATRVVVPLDTLTVPSWMAREVTGELHVDTMAVATPPPLPPDAGTDPGEPVALRGRVLWLAGSSGWIGVRPVPDGTATRPVELLRTVPEDLPGWLSPMIATALDATVPPPDPQGTAAGTDTPGEQP